MSQQIPARIGGGAVDLSHLVAKPDAMPGSPGSNGAGSPGQVVEVPSLVIDATEANFEQIAQLSAIVPVVIDLWSARSQPSQMLSPILEQLTREHDGQILLAKVDVDANPGLAQAFQVQSIPTVLALVAGRPVPLFQGAIPEVQARELFAQLLQLGQQQGLSGRVQVSGDGESDAPIEAPVNPAHEPALEALDRGDFAGAVLAYEQVLLKAPADHEARAALVQVRLLERLQGASADEIRAAAAANAKDVTAQMRVADLDVSGGHIEDAFLRLLELFAATSDVDERAAIRERLLELFEVVGVADPRVIAARGRLANLLY